MGRQEVEMLFSVRLFIGFVVCLCIFTPTSEQQQTKRNRRRRTGREQREQRARIEAHTEVASSIELISREMDKCSVRRASNGEERGRVSSRLGNVNMRNADSMLSARWAWRQRQHYNCGAETCIRTTQATLGQDEMQTACVTQVGGGSGGEHLCKHKAG